ncbi:MAG: MltA domain-containing protein [Methylocystis sp.]
MPPPLSVDPNALSFGELEGLLSDDLGTALQVFRRSAKHILTQAAQQRPALTPSKLLVNSCDAALSHTGGGAEFFLRWFSPHRVCGKGFLTGYYEVEVEARRCEAPGFRTPVLSRPVDLVTLNDTPMIAADGAALTSARRRPDGGLEPFSERREIEDEASGRYGPPLAYVRDRVELFLMQVQGSARLRFGDGSTAALTYDGRNGHPYTSIGRLLIARGLVPQAEMTLETLKQTLRELGQEPGEAGRLLMQENKSYVFFRIDDSPERGGGPIGGQGCALTPLRSIAVDRGLWCYGLPFFISGTIPWESEAPSRFARLMIAQDTGSAILGAARADLYFGSGATAGRLAGGVRHEADFFVLLPRGAEGS